MIVSLTSCHCQLKPSFVFKKYRWLYNHKYFFKQYSLNELTKKYFFFWKKFLYLSRRLAAAECLIVNNVNRWWECMAIGTFGLFFSFSSVYVMRCSQLYLGTFDATSGKGMTTDLKTIKDLGNGWYFKFGYFRILCSSGYSSLKMLICF